MSKLLITTQFFENYGAHNWDGEGECPQYWKAKGGNDYFVLNVERCAAEVVELYKALCECNNDYWREYVLGWKVVPDDYVTKYEQDQLDYMGKILFPAPVLRAENLEV